MAIELKGPRVLVGTREFAREIQGFPEVKDIHIGETDTGMSGRARSVEFKVATSSRSVLITLMLGEGQQKYSVFPQADVTCEALLAVLTSRISSKGRVLLEHKTVSKPPTDGSKVASQNDEKPVEVKDEDVEQEAPEKPDAPSSPPSTPVASSPSSKQSAPADDADEAEESEETSLVELVEVFDISLEEGKNILRLYAATNGGELPSGATRIVGNDLWSIFKRMGYITSVGKGRASVATMVWERFEGTEFCVNQERRHKQARFFHPAEKGVMRAEDAWHIELQEAVDACSQEEEEEEEEGDEDEDEAAASSEEAPSSGEEEDEDEEEEDEDADSDEVPPASPAASPDPPALSAPVPPLSLSKPLDVASARVAPEPPPPPVVPISPTLQPPPPAPSSHVPAENPESIVAPPAPGSASVLMPVGIDFGASLADLAARLDRELVALRDYEAREIVPAREKIAAFEARVEQLERYRVVIGAFAAGEALVSDPAAGDGEHGS